MTKTGTFRKRIVIAVTVTVMLLLIGGVWFGVGRDYLTSKRRTHQIVALLKTESSKDVNKARALLMGYPDGFEKPRARDKPKPLGGKDAELIKRVVMDGLTSFSDYDTLFQLLFFIMYTPSESGITYSDNDWMVIEAAMKKYNAQLDSSMTPFHVYRGTDGSRKIMPPVYIKD